MKSEKRAVIEFHKQLFDWSEAYLLEEYATKFLRLRALGTATCNKAIGFIETIPVSEIESFVHSFVRRLYRDELLDLLEERSEVHPMVTNYSEHLRSEFQRDSCQTRVGYKRDEKARVLNGLKRKYQGTAFNLTEILIKENLGQFSVSTYIDTGHRSGAISYCHRSVKLGMDELNFIPLSTMSWTGISTVTKWDDRSLTGSDAIPDILDKQFAVFFAFLRKVPIIK